MLVIPSVCSVFYDVDDTLVMWNNIETKDIRAIPIICAGSHGMSPEGKVASAEEWTAWIIPHKAHIEQLKIHKSRGHLVVVWSAGGWEWARAAVKALELEAYVDVVISKPNWAYDDKSPEDYMPKSYYIKQE